MTSNNPHKRKTLKLRHPNPLFEKWLEDWKDEAATKNSDTQYAFAKALMSLKKYPLPLKSGKECLILENFGPRICLLLDRKLADHKKLCKDKQDPEDLGESADEDELPQVKELRKTPKKSNKELNKTSKLYIPTLRSASYAILVALNEHLKLKGPPGDMTKGELQKASQPLCDTSMFKPLPGSYYSGWSCMGQLIRRQLIKRSGNPHRYALTDDGISLANKLLTADGEKSENDPCSSSLQKQTEQPKANNRKRKNAAKNTKVLDKNNPVCSEKIQPSFQPEDILLSSEDCLTQSSANTLSSQIEEIIFLPGSFQILLLVDTQEIHKGDELVRALEAQGVTLEVRKLKVGDFTWVSRNAAGQELLLPFIIERKRLDDLASSIKDGRFHEQKFRMKQCGVPNCIYLVESHGQRQFSLPTSTLLQAAANTQIIDKFTVKYTANSHETVVYLATFSKVLDRKFSSKTLIGCLKTELPKFDIQDDCISLMSFKEFNKLSSKTRKYCVKEMFIKHLVQLRGLSVEKALAIVERYPTPRSLMRAFKDGENEHLLTEISVGNLNRKIGPVMSKTLFELYNKSVLSYLEGLFQVGYNLLPSDNCFNWR